MPVSFSVATNSDPLLYSHQPEVRDRGERDLQSYNMSKRVASKATGEGSS